MGVHVCEHVQAHPRKALAVHVEALLGSVRLCKPCAATWLGISIDLLGERLRAFANHAEDIKGDQHADFDVAFPAHRTRRAKRL